jgi:hypothetical protein
MRSLGRRRATLRVARIARAFESSRGRFGVELLLLALWTLSVARAYLTLDPTRNPTGREYFPAIQNNVLWERARDCGACAFWNGNARGGYPAFADPHNAALHPVVAATTLAFGALNGAKLALVAVFFLAGAGQWWLAKELGLAWPARLWSAGMAVAAGNLAGRMEQGSFALVTSTAMATLALPPLLRLHRTGARRDAALLGVTLGLLILAGQQYLQIGFGMLLPLAVLLIVESRHPLRLLIRRYLLALALAFLIGAPFLVPFAHFAPSFSKWLDPEFAPAQPARYVPLNLILHNWDSYNAQQYGTLPYPFLYTNYIGWVAVALAVVGVGLLARRRPHLALFLVAWALGAMWIASAMPLRWLRDLTVDIPALWEFVVGIRNAPLIAGLAIPALLALAATAFDAIWQALAAAFARSPRRPTVRDLRNLAIPLAAGALLAWAALWSLTDARDVARRSLRVVSPPSDLDAVLDALETPSAAWIDPPFGEEFWYGEAIGRNMKLSYNVTIWAWSGRVDPTPEVVASRFDAPDGMTWIGSVGEIDIYAAPPGHEYAAIVHADGSRTPCIARSYGGDIEVACDSPTPARLVVEENAYAGWRATVDGRSQPLVADDRLSIDVPAGPTTIRLRYRPWDAPFGLALAFAGALLAGWMIVRNEPRPIRHESTGDSDRVESTGAGIG